MENIAKFDVGTDMSLEPLNTVCTHDEPDFESSETATEWDLPISVIGNQSRLRVFVAKV